MNERLEPRIRILLGSSIAIGPGKAMNACFKEPLIETAKGGSGGGGARLTDTGCEVLALYRAMEDHAATAVMPDMDKLRALMVDEPPED